MKRTVAIISVMAICVLAVAQPKRNNLPYNMSEDVETSTIGAVTTGDTLFTIIGATGVKGNLPAMLPGLVDGKIHGENYITLVDGIERDASYLRPEEIESVTVLTDAAALAAYGLRGANGALLVKTKMGYEGPTRISVDYHFQGDTPFRQPEMASAPEYCMAVNEALANDGLPQRYSLADINALANGTSIFANNNWQDLLTRGFSSEHKLTFTAEGHEKTIRYFVLANYTGTVGPFNNTNLNNGYSTQKLGSALSIRSNFEVMLTKTTQLAAHLSASLEQSQSGSDNTAAMFSTPSFVFPITTEDGEWVASQNFANPFRAQCGGGYTVSLARRFTADITLNQDLSMVTKGLSAQLMLAYDAIGSMYDVHGVSSYYYQIDYDLHPDSITDSYTLTRYGNDTGNTFSGGNQTAASDRYAGWIKVDWQREFGKHNVGLNALYTLNHYKGLGNTNVSANMDGVFHAHYGYDKRYIADFTGTVSCSGLVKTPTFLPAISAAWVASNESFLKNVSWLDYLKVKASWGITAYDGSLTYDMDKRFNNLNNGNSYIFMQTSYRYGSVEGALASPYVVPELDNKCNVGIDLTVLKGLSFSASGYRSHRTNLQSNAGYTYSSVLGVGYPVIFDGDYTRYGVDMAVGYKGSTRNWKYNANLTATWQTGRYGHISEEANPNPYQFREGHYMNSTYILEPVGFYTPSDFDSDGNLRPGVPSSGLVSSLQPGDVKYKDINSDGKIDNNDFYYSDDYRTSPDWVFGLNLGFQYKSFGVQALFEARTGYYVNTTLEHVYQPLVGNNRNISKYYLDNYWYEGNEENARYPRLTTIDNWHNFATSPVWMEKGDFFKLRTLYVYYDIHGKWMGVMKGFRVYARGNNLFSIDNVKIFDPENISLGYPATRSFEIGAKVTF